MRRTNPPNFKICNYDSKKLCYETREGFWDFSRVPTFQHYHYIFILLFFLLPSTKTKHYSPLQEACQTSVQDCMKIILKAKRELFTIRVRLLKRRRRAVKVDPKLGDQWKDPKLGGQWKDLKLGGQWKDPKLGGQWKVPSLVANGRIQSLVAYWNVKDKHLFTSSIFPQ